MFIQLTVRIDDITSKKELFNLDKINNITTSKIDDKYSVIDFGGHIFTVLESYDFIVNRLKALDSFID